MPELRLLQGDRRSLAPRKPRGASARLILASDRLDLLEQLLRGSGRPAEAMAARHVRDLVAEIAGELGTGAIA